MGRNPRKCAHPVKSPVGAGGFRQAETTQVAADVSRILISPPALPTGPTADQVYASALSQWKFLRSQSGLDLAGNSIPLTVHHHIVLIGQAWSLALAAPP